MPSFKAGDRVKVVASIKQLNEIGIRVNAKAMVEADSIEVVVQPSPECVEVRPPIGCLSLWVPERFLQPLPATPEVSTDV
jgi:hypothetical protein